MLELDLKRLEEFASEQEFSAIRSQTELAYQTLAEGSGQGSDYIAWFDLPISYDRAEFQRIQELASKIREENELFIVAGIGGSYLGAKALSDALNPNFMTARERRERYLPELIFLGNNLSPDYLQDAMEYIGEHNVALNVISKSGGTLETALAFRILEAKMQERYGVAARERISCTTDKSRGKLRAIAEEKGYETFVIPSDIGGRYSVLTAVGLLPLAVAGVNIEDLMAGAQEAKLAIEKAPWESLALRYAAARNILYRKGYNIEVLASFEPALASFHEWWKQLFGESEGKDSKGIFPASLSYSRDLHSMGQYMQDGRRTIMETFLAVRDARQEITIPVSESNRDELNYLAGKSLSEIQALALEGTALAHAAGGVPNIKITLDRLDAWHLGALVFNFEVACAVSAYLNAVNPFNQEGVEAYKKNMFALLGREDLQALKEELERKI